MQTEPRWRKTYLWKHSESLSIPPLRGHRSFRLTGLGQAEPVDSFGEVINHDSQVIPILVKFPHGSKPSRCLTRKMETPRTSELSGFWTSHLFCTLIIWTALEARGKIKSPQNFQQKHFFIQSTSIYWAPVCRPAQGWALAAATALVFSIRITFWYGKTENPCSQQRSQ